MKRVGTIVNTLLDTLKTPVYLNIVARILWEYDGKKEELANVYNEIFKEYKLYLDVNYKESLKEFRNIRIGDGDDKEIREYVLDWLKPKKRHFPTSSKAFNRLINKGIDLKKIDTRLLVDLSYTFAKEDIEYFNFEDIDCLSLGSVSHMFYRAINFDSKIHIDAPLLMDCSYMLADCPRITKEVYIKSSLDLNAKGLLRDCAEFNNYVTLDAKSLDISFLLYCSNNFCRKVNIDFNKVTKMVFMTSSSFTPRLIQSLGDLTHKDFYKCFGGLPLNEVRYEFNKDRYLGIAR